MAFCTILSAALQGLAVEPVRVEADVSNGLPIFHMVGYLSSEVKEAAARVRTAVKNAGIQLPPKRIVVNLAPATLRKRGASFDLPIALAVMGALDLYDPSRLGGTLVIGELSLDGSVREVPGILPIVLAAREIGCHTCILPKGNAAEGALAKGVRILGVDSLKEAGRYLRGEIRLHPAEEGNGGPPGIFRKKAWTIVRSTVRNTSNGRRKWLWPADTICCSSDRQGAANR